MLVTQTWLEMESSSVANALTNKKNGSSFELGRYICSFPLNQKSTGRRNEILKMAQERWGGKVFMIRGSIHSKKKTEQRSATRKKEREAESESESP